MDAFLVVGLTISRILSRLVIYLGPPLLAGSSGLLYDKPRAGSSPLGSGSDISLAADRVYHRVPSPIRETVLRSRFILSVASAEGGEALLSGFCGTFPRITPGCR